MSPAPFTVYNALGVALRDPARRVIAAARARFAARLDRRARKALYRELLAIHREASALAFTQFAL